MSIAASALYPGLLRFWRNWIALGVAQCVCNQIFDLSASRGL